MTPQQVEETSKKEDPLKLKNGESREEAAGNVKEMISTIEIPKLIVDNKLIDVKFGEFSFLNEENKENFQKFVKLSSKKLMDFEQSIKATIVPFLQHTNTTKNRRQKRMDNNHQPSTHLANDTRIPMENAQSIQLANNARISIDSAQNTPLANDTRIATDNAQNSPLDEA